MGRKNIMTDIEMSFEIVPDERFTLITDINELKPGNIIYITEKKTLRDIRFIDIAKITIDGRGNHLIYPVSVDYPEPIIFKDYYVEKVL